jgi:SH3-like domain-containing protein
MKFSSYFFLMALLLGIGFVSCGRNSSSLHGANSSVVDPALQKDLFVWVENARVRKEPDLKAEVIAEIKGGEKLSLTGEVSTNKIKVNLRGVDFEDVWAKVKTSEGQEGWIFKGMLTEDENKAKAMNDFLIVPGERIGQIKLLSGQEDAEKIFGKEFVAEGDIYIGEGVTKKGFYLFKNSPLELQCPLDENKKIFGIYVRQPGGNWATKEGVKMGTTLDELAKLNERPIKFNGFGWDFGGLVYDFNKGKLEAYYSSLSIVLGEPDNIEGLDEFMGDVECTTANNKIMGKGVKVAELAVFGAPSL